METKIPFSSFYSEIRKTSTQGGSLTVRLPADFTKALKTLNEEDLKMFNLNNNYIVYQPKKMSSSDFYDLLQLVFASLEVLYHNVDADAKKNIEEAYKLLLPLQEIL